MSSESDRTLDDNYALHSYRMIQSGQRGIYDLEHDWMTLSILYLYYISWNRIAVAVCECRPSTAYRFGRFRFDDAATRPVRPVRAGSPAGRGSELSRSPSRTPLNVGGPVVNRE